MPMPVYIVKIVNIPAQPPNTGLPPRHAPRSPPPPEEAMSGRPQEEEEAQGGILLTGDGADEIGGGGV